MVEGSGAEVGYFFKLSKNKLEGYQFFSEDKLEGYRIIFSNFSHFYNFHPTFQNFNSYNGIKIGPWHNNLSSNQTSLAPKMEPRYLRYFLFLYKLNSVLNLACYNIYSGIKFSIVSVRNFGYYEISAVQIFASPKGAPKIL